MWGFNFLFYLKANNLDPNSPEPLIKWIFFSALAFPTLVLRLFKFKSALLSSCHLRSPTIRTPFKVANYEKVLNYVQFTLPKLARKLINQIPWIFPILTALFNLENLAKETNTRAKHICFNNLWNSKEYDTFFIFNYPEAKYVPLLFIYLFIYLFLFLDVLGLRFVRGLSPVAASGGHSSSRCAGLSLSRPLPLRGTGSRRAGSVILAHGPSRSAACGILRDQGLNPCLLH